MSQLEIAVRIDEYCTEIIDAGHKIKVTTKSQYDRINLEKKSKREKTIGYQQTHILGSRDDFNKSFDSIFLID